MPIAEHPPLLWTFVDSPIGRLLLAGDGSGLSCIRFSTGRTRFEADPEWREDATPFVDARAQLRAWFASELRYFDLPLAPRGTVFQQSVWRALRTIPFGETTSYADIALKIGRPSASRAVGAANGANPLPIVVPCHRVIGANGALTGFASGIETKRWLLAHEARAAGPTGRSVPIASDQLGLF